MAYFSLIWFLNIIGNIKETPAIPSKKTNKLILLKQSTKRESTSSYI